MAARTGVDTKARHDDIYVRYESAVRPVYTILVSGRDHGPYRGHRDGTARLQLSSHMDVQ